MNNKFFQLKYHADGEDCPYHLPEEGNTDEWEWSNFEPNPFSIDIKKKYSFKVLDKKIKNINFDFYGETSPYISNKFFDLCNSFSIKFRSIPIEIILFNGTRPKKTYSVFLAADHLSILDQEKSIFETEIEIETGFTMMNKFFQNFPIYSKIEKFVIKEIDIPDLFFCIDNFSLVCSEKFRDESINLGLKGINFVLLDEQYKYDPWHQIN